MRRDALVGELATSALPDETRATYQKEVDNLSKELATFDSEAGWITLLN